jgi:hypothetical protein
LVARRISNIFSKFLGFFQFFFLWAARSGRITPGYTKNGRPCYNGIMGIFDRLGDVIKSYINDGEEPLFGRRDRDGPPRDPDLSAAFEELDEFLSGREGASPRQGGAGSAGGTQSAAGKGGTRPVPEELRKDFAELGLPPGASKAECKTAYKRLLKLHHPDRHAGHEGNTRKATEKSARLNTAFDRIEAWRTAGRF